MTPPEPFRALEHIQSLPSWLVGRVAARGRSLVAEAIAGEGLKLPHHAVLAAVFEYGPVAQADLVRRLSIDAKDLVGFLNHLEGAGLLVREPDPRDRRKNAVTVTTKGTRTLRRCAELGERANEELLSPLDAAERQALIALLTKLHQVPSPDADHAQPDAARQED
ncbi:MarR family winged helix-turn-helix transcriptional regulator [Kitasatospora sp. DSM 101779]|jgi:DNA-binding MarR family transcriptional regulator|uniref:MarR family winged helix-turn-helix transcriptional regulator n=1 Tax=Kitasatospora sp. DSM 101779 TaxID=2853165 RepID=UPI0021D97EF4|nr:MarR family transcriptional regulator [Kitasatospora sp. DSM 101779]MCU7820259.1 MarR family transcriptional regulator [Kitasatospora sp. DSM 101779]